MVRRLTTLGMVLAASLALISYCLYLNPGAADWRRLRLPNLTNRTPPLPAAMGFAPDLRATWHEPERFNFYRGSETRDGVYRDGPIAPPLKIEWATESFNIGIHGASKGSPAVDASGIYVGSDSGWIRAYRHDGSLRWKFRVSNAVRGIHSTPLLTSSRVYLGSYGGRFYVLGKDDGALLWTFHLRQTAFGSSPLVVDGRLIAVIETETLNAFVTAMDPRDGRVIWRSPYLGEQIHSSPAFDRATNTILVGANNKTLFAIDAADGHVVWRRFLGGEIKGTPLIDRGAVYVSSWSGKLHALNVVTGRIQWESSLEGASQSSPTLIPGTDRLIVADGRGSVSGIDRRDGRKWWSIKFDEMIMSSALAAPDRRGRWLAWIGCVKDHLCAIDPAAGRVVQSLALPGSLSGVPVGFGGSLYLSLNYPGGLIKLSPVSHAADAL